MKEKIDWLGMFNVTIFAIIFATIGISLPATINKINGFPIEAFYGHWASYVISILLFFLVAGGTQLTKEVKK